MKRVLIAVALASVFTVLGVSAALADGGPHGGYVNPVTVASSTFAATTINTDACAGCHRIHTAQSDDRLLRLPTEYQLCVDCHNGTGSVLDVLDGKRLAATVTTPPTGGNPSGGDLNGGGFNFQKGQPVTSRHPVNAGVTQAWGAGTAAPGTLADFDVTTGTSATLDCSSCHDPHGSKNYRILNEQVSGLPGTSTATGTGQNVSVLAWAPTTPTGAASSATFTKDDFGPGIQAGTPSTKYTIGYYASNGLVANGGFFGPLSATNIATRNGAVTPGDSAATGTALLCGACHTAYPSPNAMDTTYDSASGMVRRHMTEGPWNTFDSWNSSMRNPAGTWTTTTTTGTATTVSSVPLRLASNANGAPTAPPGATGYTVPTNVVGNQTTVTCLTCHNAHGSSSQETGFALTKALGGTSNVQISPAQVSGDISTLLVADNRAMCEACHQKATPWS